MTVSERSKRGGFVPGPALFFCAALALAILFQVTFLQATVQAGNGPQDGRRGGQRPRPEPSKVTVGEYPPDFNLPYLTFETSDGGKPVGVIDDSKKFRLSDLRGKKPVCLIMSSYT